MTAYTSDLSSGNTLFIDNQETQTLVTLSSNSPGQQQSQRISFETGSWIMPPILLRTGIGLILQVESSKGKTFILVQGNQVQLLTTPPTMTGTDILPLQQVNAAMPQMQPIKPMQPMQPMKMGNMEMNMNPMRMRMGDMELKMESAERPESGNHFCTQCGNAVQEGDRFCSNCGHQLGQSK